MTVRQQPDHRADYCQFLTITTRWMDNDVYGHINNVQYYSYFDTAVNRFLIDRGVLDIHDGAVIGLVVETHCNYFSAAAYPQDIEAGIRVVEPGRSSVRYEVGLFIEAREEAIAQGYFIHVYVDRENRTPVELSADLRAVVSDLGR